MRTFRSAICPHRKIAPIPRAGKLLPGLFLLCLLPHDVRSADEPEPEVLLTIVYSADINGYLEPCGCGGVKEGGIARQATLLNQMRGQGPVLAISGGGFGDYPEAVSAMLRASLLMCYDIVAPTMADWALVPGMDEAWPDERGPEIIVEGTDRPCLSRRFQTGGLRLGILVLGEQGATLAGLGLVTEAWAEQYQALIVVSHMDTDANTLLLEALGNLTVPSVILGHVTDSVADRARSSGLCVEPGVPGRGRGLVRVILARRALGGPLDLQTDTVRVSSDVPSSRDVAALVDDYYAMRLRTDLAVDGEPHRGMGRRKPVGESPTDPEQAYVTAVQCGRCHPERVGSWELSLHGRAEAALVQAGRLLPECLLCHSSRVRHGGGAEATVSARPGQGVECVECHGDGVLHAITGLPGYISLYPQVETCTTCHTADDSPNFDFHQYRTLLSCLSGSSG